MRRRLGWFERMTEESKDEIYPLSSIEASIEAYFRLCVRFPEDKGLREAGGGVLLRGARWRGIGGEECIVAGIGEYRLFSTGSSGS